MSKKKVLFISHGHPDLVVGGAEIVAYELYSGLRESNRFEMCFLARSLSSAHQSASHPFFALESAPDELLWSPGPLDVRFSTLHDKRQYTEHLVTLLAQLEPDLVHVQHSHGLGFELLQAIRTAAPAVPILYTLHEFLPICHAHGHLLRTFDQGLCAGATPLRCHECFPETPPELFLLRERFIKAQLAHVDLFLAPSRQLLERYVQWGLPREKLLFEDYGRRPPAETAREPADLRTFGFFGQITPDKGVLTLLEAMRMLARRGVEAHLFLNGANLQNQPAAFRSRFEDLVGSLDNVTFQGPFERESLPARMSDCAWVVVPSLWYENSPLVIQEAFLHRRPVICSNIGGMAEKVRDGIDGLLFPVASPEALSRTLQSSCESPELWRRLTDGIGPIYSLEETVRFHANLYDERITKGPSSACSP